MLEIARHLGLHELKGGKRTRVLNALRAGLADRAPVPRVATVYSPEERNRVLAALRRPEPGGGAALPRARGAVPRAAARARTRPTGASPSSTRDALLDDWVAPVIRALVG